MNRRDFIAESAAFVGSAGAAIAKPPSTGPVMRRIAVVKGCEVFRRDASRSVVDRLLAERNDMVFVDVQDAITYPSHPEIATERSLAAGEAKGIVEVCRAKGLELLPLVDFSTVGDSWLGEYDRMVCSKAYRRVVEDVIRDAMDTFAGTKALHIGFENESRSAADPNGVAVMRQGDLWMREFAWTVGLVEGCGAKCWAWFDYPWGIKDFLAGCPRSVTLVNLKSIDAKMESKLAQIERIGVSVARRLVS